MQRMLTAMTTLVAIGVMSILTPPGVTADSVSINVKELGAKGDGVTDDTAALEAAVKMLNARSRLYWNDLVGVCFPEVVFQEGTYLISRPIVFAPLSGALLRGEGKAIIRQTTPSADIFALGGFRVFIDNLTFEGGRRAIKIATDNTDTSCTTVRNCTFRNTSDYAIECLSKRNAKGEFVDTYKLNSDGSVTHIEDDPSAEGFYNSTLLHINGCHFMNCTHVLNTTCDGCFMENSEMETSPEMKGAAIRTAGSITRFCNVRCLLHVKEENNQRWIDNGLTLIATQLSLKTDATRGVCPIYNSAKFQTGYACQRSLVLEDSEFDVSGCPENAVIYCEEFPNMISLRNCRATRGPAVPALGFKKAPDPQYFRYHAHMHEPIVPVMFGYTVEEGNRNILPNLPDSMKPYERKPLPKKISESIRKWMKTSKEDFLCEAAMTASRRKVLKASDFGVKADGASDDTEAIRKAVNAAGLTPGSELQFPSGIYRLSATIDLPEDITLRGMGRAAFQALQPGQGCFRVREVERLAVYNCAFESVAHAVSISVAASAGRAKSPARILFQNCVFNGTTAAAVECVAGNGETDASAMARLRITDCVAVRCRQNLVSNVSAVVDNTWISTGFVDKGSTIRDLAFIENRGTLRFENVLGVPLVDAIRNDIRWIDNYGQLLCEGDRFGGEYGGIPAVNIRRTPGVRKNAAVLQHCWLYNQNKKDRECLVYCEDLPDLLVLQSNTGIEDPRFLEKDGFHLATLGVCEGAGKLTAGKNLFLSGNTIPEDLRYEKYRPARILSPPVAWKVMKNPVDGAEMMFVPAGDFIMGSKEGSEEERPVRTVHLDDYWMYKNEVTVAQYRKFCDTNGRRMPPAPSFGWDDKAPIVNVTWEDAAAYCKWAGGRLPTEAEWEKAARGMDGLIYPWGNGWDKTACNQWESELTGKSPGGQTLPVGSYPYDVSPYGCFDMAGNVCEWCADWYDRKYYKAAPVRNPSGPTSGKYRAIRGGGWSNLGAAGSVRLTMRKCGDPGGYWFDLGFRVARNSSGEGLLPSH